MAGGEVAIGGKDVLEGLGKGLRVIEAFNEDRPRMTPSEVAEVVGISRTAARRYLLSLCHFGYAATDGRQFWLGPRVLRLGQSFLDGARMPRTVQPFLQRLALASGETVNVSVLDGHEIVYLAHSNGPRLVSIGFQAGSRAPAHVVTPGYIATANLEAQELEDWIAHHEFSRFTAHTVTDVDEFRERVEVTRRLGYAHSQQQLDIGLHGIAVALQDRKGKFLGAIGMTVQLRSMSKAEVVDKMLPLLIDTQQTLRSVL